MKKFLSTIIMRILTGNCVDMKYNGYIDYPGVGEISDAAVYRFVVNHSRLIDRLNPAKMTEMALLGQCILMGIYTKIDPNDLRWKFYGKHALKDEDLS